MKALILVMTIFLACASCFSQERIQEEVSVDWWVVPLFAVDRDGNAVTDLKKEDMQLLVNKRPTAEFVLTRRLFDVSEKLPPGQSVPVAEKKKMMFLIFDIVYSNLGNFKKSVGIAKSLVEGSAASTTFSIFTIDPFAGLVYLGGPLEQKTEVLALIQKKVVLNPRAKSIETIKEMNSLIQRGSGKGGSLYGEGELKFFLEEQGITGLKNINKNYFRSLESLTFVLNSIQDNKFVYLFSEGISTFSRQVIRHQDAEYQELIIKCADLLGRCGAVLFIINPAGVSLSPSDASSGEDSLRELAEKSGGKYLEGETQSISRRIQNMHRAYYEIAFPDRGDDLGTVRNIILAAKRPGVSVHSIHSLEKSKPYVELNDLEKEIFALNLINRNPFFLKRMALPELIVKKHYRKEAKEVYEIVIPDGWTRHELDLYKARIDQNTGNAEIEKSLWLPEKAEQTIELDGRGNGTVGFVVINPKAQAALLLKPETKKTDAPVIEKIPEIKAMADEFKYNADMATILAGAAGYCDQLKQAAFHYYCSEKVVETLSSISQDEDDISTFSPNASDDYMLRRSQSFSRIKGGLVSKFTFDYQLIRNENEVQEKRKLISAKKKNVNEENVVARMKAFLAEKAVFAPVTLFARERQPLYEYRFIAYEKMKGVRCAVLEVLPRSQEDARYVYGQAWIDMADYSVLKIKANPRSIGGYEKLQAIAKQLAAKLFLSLEITFNQVHDGIRFPDQVVLSERYKGGRLMFVDRSGKTSYLMMGSDGWERNRTEYSYQDYRFFEVGVQTQELDLYETRNDQVAGDVETEKTDAPMVEKIPEIKPMADEFKYSTEMAAILEGVAGYCKKLKQSVFHYFCTEKVVETNGWIHQDHNYSRVGKFTFDYQLLKKENEIQEQRKLISKKKEHENEENVMATLKAFFLAEKAVFAPIDMFARERQPLYEYRFIAYEKLKGVRCALIEVLPRSQKDSRYVYGQAWIDTADYSLLKIKVNPRSVVGYEKLQAIARSLGAKLFLNLEISFEQTHAVMRFPDAIVISEVYKGWRLAGMGLQGWERNRTEYSYLNYRFFEVGVQVTEKLQ